MRLYLLRHGKPVIEPGYCYGSTDLGVPPEEQDRVINAALPFLPRDVALYASPLRRCRELACTLAERLGAPMPVVDARLAEMHFGAWEMQRWDHIPRMEIDAWAADMANYRPGNGERVVDVTERVCGFHADLLARSAGRTDSADSVINVANTHAAIVVAHAGTMRLLKESVLGGSPGDIALRAARSRHEIAYGELIILDCGRGNAG